MSTNRERAEALFYTWEYDKPLDDIIVTIEAALDEAERRGFRTGQNYRWPISSPATLNAILDKVVAMDRCWCKDGLTHLAKAHWYDDLAAPCVCCGRTAEEHLNDGEPHDACNGTGYGPIARYVKEARG